MLEYQAAKRSLRGDGAPFSGWVKSGRDWESFDSEGMTISPVEFK